MRVLVACEFSGIVREAFAAHGHDAWSCDLLETEQPGQHIIGDVRSVLGDGWDLMVAHPPCTYLTGAAEWAYGDGPYHQQVKPGTLVGAARREARREALQFVRDLMAAPIPLKAIENPVGKIGTIIRKADQILQPFNFGDDASKATCLWLQGLPILRFTAFVPGRTVEWPRGSGRTVERWANQTDSGQNRLSPSAGRAHERSRTYQGIAAAMATQWGSIAENAARIAA